MYLRKVATQDHRLHGVHLGLVIHLRNGMEEENLLPEPIGEPHLEKCIAADVARNPLFIVIKDEDGIGLFNFTKMLADEIVFDLGCNALFVFHWMHVPHRIHEFNAFGNKNNVPYAFEPGLDLPHLLVKLHAAADSNFHIFLLPRFQIILLYLSEIGAEYE